MAYRPQAPGASLYFRRPAAMSFVSEFRDFAMKGNVVDMAVGVIIGGAFGKLVTSIVDKVMTPPIALITSGVNFSEYNVTLRDAVKVVENGKEVIKTPAVTIGVGDLINTVIQFTITALCLFLVIKAVNVARARFEKKKEAGAVEPPAQEKLLAEIRDLLKAKA
jgi:large conductance mechanosensitive channel